MQVPTDPEAFNLLTSKMKDRIPGILEDMARDNIILKENRWPYVSTRAPVTSCAHCNKLCSLIDLSHSLLQVPSSEKNESFRSLNNRPPLYPPELCSSVHSTSKPKSKKGETKSARLRREHAQKLLVDREEQARRKQEEERQRKEGQRKLNREYAKKLSSTKRKEDQKLKVHFYCSVLASM